MTLELISTAADKSNAILLGGQMQQAFQQ